MVVFQGIIHISIQETKGVNTHNNIQTVRFMFNQSRPFHLKGVIKGISNRIIYMKVSAFENQYKNN